MRGGDVLSGRQGGDVVFQLGFGDRRMTNLLTTVSSAKPREKAGAHTLRVSGARLHSQDARPTPNRE